MAQVLRIHPSRPLPTRLGGFLAETGGEKTLAGLRGRARSWCLQQTFQIDHLWTKYILLQFTHLLDASREDGSFVMLKHISISRHPHEVEVGQLFSLNPLVSDPKNRCAPFYDVLRVPNDDDRVILVMPLLYRVENPPFQTVGEVVEFCRQIFEVPIGPSLPCVWFTFFPLSPQGLQFMHQNHTAHRYVSSDNKLFGSLTPSMLATANITTSWQILCRYMILLLTPMKLSWDVISLVKLKFVQLELRRLSNIISSTLASLVIMILRLDYLWNFLHGEEIILCQNFLQPTLRAILSQLMSIVWAMPSENISWG